MEPMSTAVLELLQRPNPAVVAAIRKDGDSGERGGDSSIGIRG